MICGIDATMVICAKSRSVSYDTFGYTSGFSTKVLTPVSITV